MSTAPSECDLAVVGAGILGLAVARELSVRSPGRTVAVLERNASVGTEQTGRNSGVIHAGIYYAPGSLKAQLCVAGARELYEYCEARGDPLRALRQADRRAGLRASSQDSTSWSGGGARTACRGCGGCLETELHEVEPHVRGRAALHSPKTGIVDFREIARSLAAELEQRQDARGHGL